MIELEGAKMHGFKSYLAGSFGIVLFGGLLLIGSGLWPAQAASPSVEFKKIFSKMDRDLCRSLSLANCKRATAQKERKVKVGKTAKSKPRKATPVNPKPVVSKPVPEVKQVERKPEVNNIPVPTLKPASLTGEKIPVTPPPPPEVKVVILPSPVLPHGMPDGTPQGEACYDSLAKLGVEFKRLSTPVGTGVCSVVDAVEMQSISISGSMVKLPDHPTFNCGFASKFASWIRNEAGPIVTKATDTKIASLGTGPGFQCRGRNGDSSAKTSEHGFGNAVDIERIKLVDGETILIKDAMTIGANYQPVLATLRASGCRYFTTVLGPGANSAHAEHFHFDLARRGKMGNHSMCQ
jgi:hypothetical protein